MVSDLVHGRGIVETAVDHRVDDLLRVAEILQRVAVHDDEIGQLSGFQGSEVSVAVRMDSSGVIPPCSNIHISQCTASPSRWPWAPILTMTPERSSNVAAAAA